MNVNGRMNVTKKKAFEKTFIEAFKLEKRPNGPIATRWSLNEMSWMLASTNITIINIIATIIVDGLHPLLFTMPKVHPLSTCSLFINYLQFICSLLVVHLYF
jgi:hypothetical protein